MTKEETQQILRVLQLNYPQSFRGWKREQANCFLNLWSEAFKDTPVELVTKAVKDIIYNNQRDFMPNIAQVRSKIKKMSQPLLASREYDEEYHDKHCNDWVDEYITDEMWEKYFPNDKRTKGNEQ